MIEGTDNPDSQTISIARQPIFEQNGHLWGYELFCVGNTQILSHEKNIEPSDTALCLVSSAYIFLQQILQGGKKIIVDFSEKGILDKVPYALPPVVAAIKVNEQACLRESSMEALKHLKADQYLVAINHFSGNPAFNPIYEMADIIVIEARDKESETLRGEIAAARKYNAVLLANGVKDRKLYEICRKLGFSIFSGPYFKFPDTVAARKLSSNQVLRLNLLKLIEHDTPDLAKLAETVQSDATISFRLLAFLNSAGFAFSQKIKSIHQAISLLGWSRIRNWLRVVLLTDMNQSKEAEELVLLSAQRGMFLELIAQDHDYWGFDPESLHLLGIFSLLDALLCMPMAEIIAHLPLDNKMKSALCREPNNEFLPLLRLVECFEEARWADAESMMQDLNLDRVKVMAAFQKSINWAGGLEPLSSGKPATGENRES